MKNIVYRNVQNYIVKQIITQKIKNGDALPSVRNLAQELKVNPNTIQKAYQFLDNKNLTEKKIGSGRYLKINLDQIEELKYELLKTIANEAKDKVEEMGLDIEELKKVIGLY